MTPFWRNNELTRDESQLLEALFTAHSRAARRGNISSEAVRHAAFGSGRYEQAIIAGLSTLGGTHAPIIETVDFLQWSMTHLVRKEQLPRIVPGWGNAFEKGRPDPLFADVAAIILRSFVKIDMTLQRVTELLHQRGKKIHPNPSAYTAAVAIALDIPAAVAPMLLVTGRLAAWSELFLTTLWAHSSQQQPSVP